MSSPLSIVELEMIREANINTRLKILPECLEDLKIERSIYWNSLGLNINSGQYLLLVRFNLAVRVIQFK